MHCPSCLAATTSRTLDAHLGGQVDIDVCEACQVIWFDQRESLRLTPGATLTLFRLIGDQPRAAARPGAAPMKCPRCDTRLLLTHDRQRNTPFRYWRCPREHGRLTTFFDFLREKDFIRPLSPQQIADLRRSVASVNCANCGAPVDLAHASACGHCGTALSMLDLQQVGRLAEELREADQRAHQPPGVDALFETIRAEYAGRREDAGSLVQAGLRVVARWLSSTG
jgi:hypothetical protein